MKHTPAPWAINTDRHKDESDKILVYSKVSSLRVATCYNETKSFFADKEICLANAKLIAAAPDLLEACMNLENDDNSIPEHAWNLIQNAIQKATF